MTTRVIIGSDPEFFIKNKTTGELVSAIPFIKGDKDCPVPLPNGGNIQSDNVAVEFATVPASSPKDFASIMKTTLHDTIKCLPEGHTLSVSPSALFPDKELQDKKAQEFGCMPDYCAWEMAVNDTPSHPDPRFRSCGGHIHVGCLDLEGNPIHEDSQFLLEIEGKVSMVRGMDTFHGIISTLLDNSEAAIERRTLYGKAGCHRPTSYGVEYRALSNWWTKSPMSSMLMASLTEDVVSLIVEKKLEDIINSIGAENIRNIINTGNTAEAKKILDDVLMEHINPDSKFYLEECMSKIQSNDILSSEWGL